jgi:ribosome-binding protein aMBF1 (putative translation factor)
MLKSEDDDISRIFSNSSSNSNHSIVKAEKSLAATRVTLLRKQRDLVRAYEPSDRDRWPLVIKTVLEAGVSHAELMQEIGASPSSIHRWVNDAIAPREGVRRLMHRALLDLLGDKIESTQASREKRSTKTPQPA